MSKPVARIVFTVLISLAILAAVYTTVYGAAFTAGASSGRIQVTAGLLPDLGHSRLQAPAAASTSGYYTGMEESATNKGHGGGCHHESSSAFDD